MRNPVAPALGEYVLLCVARKGCPPMDLILVLGEFFAWRFYKMFFDPGGNPPGMPPLPD